MDYQTCVLINWPFLILNIVANAFYIFCMLRPLHGERIKQPLKLLLGSLICCTAAYQMSVMMLFFSNLTTNNGNLMRASYVMSVCTLTTSMTSSAWLNFFYYTQIVPAQRALFIWIKKNIKPIIYCIWLIERILNLSDFTVMFLNNSFVGFEFSNNFSTDHDQHLSTSDYLPWLAAMYTIQVSIREAHFFFCLAVMGISSGSTLVYLCRHMRRMVAIGQPFCCSRLSGQVRVTITGILQGVLYVVCAVWSVCIFLSQQMPSPFISPYISFTVINVYMTGTTFNLGAGQTVFRLRAADFWIRATQWCKAPEVQQSERGG
ncbi:uncharacterized protein LOC120801640 [Xiphias gladius]|uniref:uncharacterized protein LOC120801640 n=1 Tax=Xiphias gladius TaxID=8245 RepID=UPI001A97FF75|nr:uncharacterized protein LOC120801640 [Xiphias gladius]